MVLAVKGLSQKYGSEEILHIESWQIEPGIYWIQGENGAGKSTLFRTLAGMLPYTGSVMLEDKYDLQKDTVDYLLRLNLGEAEPLYPAFLTPADLLTFVSQAKKSPEGQLARLLEVLGINYLKNTFGSCSSGMVKKVSLALAFLGNPSVIILDEPLITIDIDARKGLYQLIREYREKGVTFVLSTHQLFQEEGLTVTKSFRLQNKTLVEL